MVHCDVVAVLARVLDTGDAADAANWSALAIATRAATKAGSTRTAADLLGDAAQLAATDRTTTRLDQLTQNEVLDPAERSRIAAEDGAATPDPDSAPRRARRHPQRVLHDAIARRPFDGVRNVSNAIHSRIHTEHSDRLDPTGDTFADWTPRIDNRDWARHLADAADKRADQLGA